MKQMEINTVGADQFAVDTGHSVEDVQLNWGEFFSSYRVKKWRKELKNLSVETGISYTDVCRYLGTEPSELPGFYKKLPKMRETYIGVGMAYRQPLEVINRWVVKYGGKRQLYIKDAINDLIWIYLINANYENAHSDRNYFLDYEACKNALEAVYQELEEGVAANHVDTVILNKKVKNVIYDLDHLFLKEFIRENMDAFQSAYARPRKYLKAYVTQILETKNKAPERDHLWTLNSLRGYLDDSMINYLSGSESAPCMKHVPVNKKTHIALCLALGMSAKEINIYLEMMGYAHVDGTNSDEGQLINLLAKWEQAHPLQRQYKRKYFDQDRDAVLTKEEEQAAVDEMLQLRRDLKDAYEEEWARAQSAERMPEKKKKFPYLSD